MPHSHLVTGTSELASVSGITVAVAAFLLTGMPAVSAVSSAWAGKRVAAHAAKRGGADPLLVSVSAEVGGGERFLTGKALFQHVGIETFPAAA
jgi:hypothetical protein